MPKPKVIAKAKDAGKTDKTRESLVKCNVKLQTGEWISPESCQTYYIDEDAKFPEIFFEIKTDTPGPYEWEWTVSWTAEACKQSDGKKRFKAKKNSIFLKTEKFKSNERKWKADLAEILGGDLIVKAKAGGTTFIRKITILGKNPSKEKINEEIDSYSDKHNGNLAKKIFNQESRYRQFYSDGAPLTSFDNGYGLGQLTNPAPSYEQIWNWKSHINEVVKKRIPIARTTAKNYLDKHPGYTQDQLDLETLAAYNGIPKKQRYHNWSETEKKWVVNNNVLCDPDQSNKGWISTEEENKNKTIPELKSNNKSKPIYTGRCYAEHIKNNQP